MNAKFHWHYISVWSIVSYMIDSLIILEKLECHPWKNMVPTVSRAENLKFLLYLGI